MWWLLSGCPIHDIARHNRFWTKQKGLLFSPCPECLRTHADRTAEEGAEMALVLEAEAVGDLLDGKRGGLQQRFRFPNQDFADAVAGGTARHLFHHIGHIRGCEVQLIGIPFDVMMLVAALIHQRQKSSRQFLSTGKWFLCSKAVGEKFVKERQE